MSNEENKLIPKETKELLGKIEKQLTQERKTKMKAIETCYKGYRFRSRLEARWAVFFDSLGIKWEYEQEGYELPDGTRYLPDFLLHNILLGRDALSARFSDIFVEVKGNMTPIDEDKIRKFFKAGYLRPGVSNNKILVLSNIPEGDTFEKIFFQTIEEAWSPTTLAPPFNFKNIDGDNYPAFLGVTYHDQPQLIGLDSWRITSFDKERTLNAYIKAKQARFEYGETPE